MTQQYTMQKDERTRVHSLLKRFGYHSQSYNVLGPNMRYFFSTKGTEGVIAYVTHARVALGAGDPICDVSDVRTLVGEFREFCKSKRWKCCFQSVTDRWRDVWEGLGFGMLKVGEEPIYDLGRLSWTGSDFRDLRREVRRAEKHGMKVVEYQPIVTRSEDWELQMAELSRRWREFKGSGELSFLIGTPSLEEPGDRKYFLALAGENVEAFVVCTPVYARKGIYFDLMRRKEKTLSGTAQLLITKSLELLKAQGYEMATLGTVPLSNEAVEEPDKGSLIQLGIELAFDSIRYFYNIKPLYEFKDQFGPSSWEGRYLTFSPARFTPNIPYAVLKAYDPTGVTGQLKRQLGQVWKGLRWIRETPRDLVERLVR